MRYFARVTAGLEEVAWAEIAERPGIRLLGFGHRRIDFTYNGAPGHLLNLKSVDDVYVYVVEIGGLDHTRSSLGILAHQLELVDFSAALAVCVRLRPMPQLPHFSITASYLGKRNYSRYDLEKVVETVLAKTSGWKFVPNQPENHSDHDIDIRLLLEADQLLIGLRLGNGPLHRRAYKVANRPGSLKPPVANCLVRLAELQPGEILLDPMCGAGTIPIEAATFGKAGLIIGGDIAAEAVEATRLNGFGFSGLLYQGSATALPLARASLPLVITNLPWGQQVAPGEDLTILYRGVLKEIERVLLAEGRAVLLTDQATLLQKALKYCCGLHLAATLPISLFGRHPVIHLIRRC